MRLNEIMSPSVATIPPHATPAEASGAMNRQGIHHLVVLAGKTVAGVVSAHDLDGPGGARARSIAELMATDVASAAPDTTVKQAANLLRGRRVGCLPVMNGGRVVGIVTIADLLELLGRGADRGVVRKQRRPLTRRGPRRPEVSRI